MERHRILVQHVGVVEGEFLGLWNIAQRNDVQSFVGRRRFATVILRRPVFRAFVPKDVHFVADGVGIAFEVGFRSFVPVGFDPSPGDNTLCDLLTAKNDLSFLNVSARKNSESMDACWEDLVAQLTSTMT